MKTSILNQPKSGPHACTNEVFRWVFLSPFIGSWHGPFLLSQRLQRSESWHVDRLLHPDDDDPEEVEKEHKVHSAKEEKDIQRDASE